MKKLFLLFVFVVLSISLCSCKKKVKSIEIIGPTSLAVGDTIILKYETKPNVDGVRVQWSSSDESIAIVDDGVIVGISEGITAIKVTVKNSKVSCKKVITVTSEKNVNDASVETFNEALLLQPSNIDAKMSYVNDSISLNSKISFAISKLGDQYQAIYDYEIEKLTEITPELLEKDDLNPITTEKGQNVKTGSLREITGYEYNDIYIIPESRIISLKESYFTTFKIDGLKLIGLVDPNYYSQVVEGDNIKDLTVEIIMNDNLQIVNVKLDYSITFGGKIVVNINYDYKL